MILPAVKKNTTCQQWRQLPWSNTASLHYQTMSFVFTVLTFNSTPCNLHLKLYRSHFSWFLLNINLQWSCSLGSQSSCFVLHKALHIFTGWQVWTPGYFPTELQCCESVWQHMLFQNLHVAFSISGAMTVLQVTHAMGHLTDDVQVFKCRLVKLKDTFPLCISPS